MMKSRKASLLAIAIGLITPLSFVGAASAAETVKSPTSTVCPSWGCDGAPVKPIGVKPCPSWGCDGPPVRPISPVKPCPSWGCGAPPIRPLSDSSSSAAKNQKAVQPASTDMTAHYNGG